MDIQQTLIKYRTLFYNDNFEYSYNLLETQIIILTLTKQKLRKFIQSIQRFCKGDINKINKFLNDEDTSNFNDRIEGASYFFFEQTYWNVIKLNGD